MSLERVLIVPDTHCPYHDTRAWKLMMKAARRWKPQTIVHLGDLADFYSISAYSKDPSRALGLEDEVKECRRLRADLDSLGAKRKLFIEGNHEDRLRRYLQDKAPELFFLVGTERLLELAENDWEFVAYRRSGKVGKVYFTHDIGGGGKYQTARALETYQHSVVIGHHHRLQYSAAGNATGQYQVGAQFGWLGDRNKIDYMHRVRALRDWALGFGVGYHDTVTGIVYLVPVPIVNYTCCLEGKVYRE